MDYLRYIPIYTQSIKKFGIIKNILLKVGDGVCVCIQNIYLFSK